MATASRRSRQALTMLVVGLSAAGPGRAVAQQERNRDDPFARMEYFYRQRAYPLQRVPPGALQAARAAYGARWPAAVRAQRLQAASSLGAWAGFGPSPILSGGARYAGRVTSIAVGLSTSRTIYAGAADGGVWRSVDGGANWTPLTDAECSLDMGSVALDPVAPSIVYAGTGEAAASYDSYFGCGVLRSTDGGMTWTRLGAQVFGNVSISKILVDAATAGSPTASTVFAATTRNFAANCLGLLRSSNSGATWAPVLTGCVTDVVQDPSTASTLYAAVAYSSNNGIYKSTDGGAHWQTVLSGGNGGRIQLAIAASQPAVLYAAMASTSGGGLLGVFKSTDAGATWTALSAGGVSCSSQCWYNLVIAVDPTDPDLVYFGGLSVYRSTDGGANFTNVGYSIHVDQHALVIDQQNPSILYAGNDGGVYKSTDYGSTWTDLNTSLSITQFSPGISAFPGAGYQLLGGTQDNGTLEYDGSPAWPQVLGGDGGFTAVNSQTPTTVFAEFQRPYGPYRRDGGPGGAFVSKSVGINLGDPMLFIPPLIMDPVDPQVLYFGTNTLYRTSDNAESWTAVVQLTASISAISVAPSGTQTIYVGTSDGAVQVTSDGGASWTNVTAGLPNRWVTGVEIDPSNHQHAYVTVSGFGAGHVFETVNRGATWQDISSNLPDVPVNAIFLHPGTGALYIGTDLGVFLSTDDGQTWGPSAAGLPNVAVIDFAFNRTTQTLYAATHGRGVFAYNLGPAILRGDVSLDGRVTAIDAQGILMGIVGLPLPAGSVFYPNGDANCSGQTSAVDAQIVLSLVVGLPTSQFCVGTVR